MSDLISRSELLKAMDTWDKFGYDEHNRLIKIDRTDEEYVPYVHYEDMVKCVKGMPTAYLVDKVVDDVRCRCYEIGLDESQTEIIVSEIVKYEGSGKDVSK